MGIKHLSLKLLVEAIAEISYYNKIAITNSIRENRGFISLLKGFVSRGSGVRIPPGSQGEMWAPRNRNYNFSCFDTFIMLINILFISL